MTERMRPSSIAGRAVSGRPPAGCSRYRARVGSRTFTYRITVEKAPRLGDAARELNIRASGDTSADIWTIIYRDGGLVASVSQEGLVRVRADSGDGDLRPK